MAKKTMTSRERALTAFNHREPDRVPCTYRSNPGLDARLKEHFGLAADDGDGLMDALDIDMRGIRIPYIGLPMHAEVPERRVNPEWGFRTRWIEHGSGGYWDFCDFPLAALDEETAANWPMPSPDDYDYASVPERCRRYEDRCIYVGGAGLCDVLNKCTMLRGMEVTLMSLLVEDPATLRLTDRRLDIELEITRRTIEAAQGRIDLMYIGDDLGGQSGPLINMDMYRRVFRPRHKRFVDLARSFDLPIMMHSDGSVSWIYDELLDMGITIADAVQTECHDMEAASLKKRFGDRMSFHGCISTGGPLAFGTPDEVEEDVRKMMEIMKPGGGFCLAPTHLMQDNTPTENALRLYEACRKYREY